jgi:tetratricopeptide (TPR) repeat protein
VQHALALDPKCAEAYFALANVNRFFGGDWAAAIADFERAAALDPNGEVGDSAQGSKLILISDMTGQYGEFFEWTRHYLDRNPLDTEALADLAAVQQAAGQLEEYSASFPKLLELNPEYATAHAQYAVTLVLMGKTADALEAAQQDSDEPSKLRALACGYWAMGRRSESDAALAALEHKFADRNRYQIATAHAYRGEADAAFAWLGRAYQQSKGSFEAL